MTGPYPVPSGHNAVRSLAVERDLAKRETHVARA
jgi:hypothetical protein